MKIALCLPVHDHTKAEFTFSLSAMQSFTAKKRPDIELLPHLVHRNAKIAEARNKLAEGAWRNGVLWMLWLDADMTFPPDTLVRLLGHTLPLVGANYRKRDASINEGTAKRLNGDKWEIVEPKADGVETVDSLGFGVLLTDARMFATLPRPLFEEGEFGEDVYFCQQAKVHGYQPHVDHALSMQVGHIAETELRF